MLAVLETIFSDYRFMRGVEMNNLAKVLEDDEKFMDLLKIIQSFELKDCWLCAGTIRNYFWNVLSGKEGFSDTHFSDVDVIFFDKKLSYEQTLALEARVKRLYPEYRWEINIICISIVLIRRSIPALGMLFRSFQKSVLP